MSEMYRLYDCINGEWYSSQEYTRDGAEKWLLKNKKNKALKDGDLYFAIASSNGDYDGNVIELRDVVKNLA